MVTEHACVPEHVCHIMEHTCPECKSDWGHLGPCPFEKMALCPSCKIKPSIEEEPPENVDGVW